MRFENPEISFPREPREECSSSHRDAMIAGYEAVIELLRRRCFSWSTGYKTACEAVTLRVTIRENTGKIGSPADAIGVSSPRNCQCLADHCTDATRRGKTSDATCPREWHGSERWRYRRNLNALTAVRGQIANWSAARCDSGVIQVRAAISTRPSTVPFETIKCPRKPVACVQQRVQRARMMPLLVKTCQRLFSYLISSMRPRFGTSWPSTTSITPGCPSRIAIPS